MYTYEYPHFALTADAILLSGKGEETEILLIQRKNDPYKDKWGFPGGFVNIDELIDDAVKRELKEETGITGVKLIRFDIFDAIQRDPRERTVTLVYYGFTDKNDLDPRAGDDAKDARWFKINDLPEMAFDHREIIDKLRRKIG